MFLYREFRTINVVQNPRQLVMLESSLLAIIASSRPMGRGYVWRSPIRATTGTRWANGWMITPSSLRLRG